MLIYKSSSKIKYALPGLIFLERSPVSQEPLGKNPKIWTLTIRGNLGVCEEPWEFEAACAPVVKIEPWAEGRAATNWIVNPIKSAIARTYLPSYSKYLL